MRRGLPEAALSRSWQSAPRCQIARMLYFAVFAKSEQIQDCRSFVIRSALTRFPMSGIQRSRGTMRKWERVKKSPIQQEPF